VFTTIGFSALAAIVLAIINPSVSLLTEEAEVNIVRRNLMERSQAENKEKSQGD